VSAIELGFAFLGEAGRIRNPPSAELRCLALCSPRLQADPPAAFKLWSVQHGKPADHYKVDSATVEGPQPEKVPPARCVGIMLALGISDACHLPEHQFPNGFAAQNEERLRIFQSNADYIHRHNVESGSTMRVCATLD
jgi:hypothetical protein